MLKIYIGFRDIIFALFGFRIGRKISISQMKSSVRSRYYELQSFGQIGEDLVLDRLFYRVLDYSLSSKGVYVDVGGYHPFDHSVTYKLYQRGWNGLVFDASRETEILFKKHRPRDVFIHGVAGDSSGDSTEFYILKSSKGVAHTNSANPADKSKYFVRNLPQVSVFEEVEKRNIKDIDLLNLDIEGNELAVLESWDYSKLRPKVIAVEVHVNSLNDLQDTPIYRLLTANGYKFVASTVITHFFIVDNTEHI